MKNQPHKQTALYHMLYDVEPTSAVRWCASMKMNNNCAEHIDGIVGDGKQPFSPLHHSHSPWRASWKIIQTFVVHTWEHNKLNGCVTVHLTCHGPCQHTYLLFLPASPSPILHRTISTCCAVCECVQPKKPQNMDFTGIDSPHADTHTFTFIAFTQSIMFSSGLFDHDLAVRDHVKQRETAAIRSIVNRIHKCFSANFIEKPTFSSLSFGFICFRCCVLCAMEISQRYDVCTPSEPPNIRKSSVFSLFSMLNLCQPSSDE